MQRLLAAGLLRQVDAETVILPRLIGQALRGELPGPVGLIAPNPVVSTTTTADVDAVAAGAVIDLLREVEVVLETLAATPIPELRSGGIGVRDVKRLTKVTGIEESRLGLILEVTAAAGLIAAGMPEPGPQDGTGPYWAPTVAADRYLESPMAKKWHLLASTWLELPGRPSLVGTRGPDGKPYAALSDSLYSTAAPLGSAAASRTLADLAPGAGVNATEASRAMIWRRPRWAARLQPDPVGALLTEAHMVGVVGRGAITTPTRTLLAGAAGEDVVKAMDKVLPRPIDHFLLQADLTVVVPGPLERELAEQLGAVARVESAGAAMVYRISEASIRRALDTGRTAVELHTFFSRHSKTPVPQGLTYLIDDVARRHGQLRVGMAASFVRCEDPALLAQAITAPAAEQLEMRLLAPTVAVSQAPISEVLTGLREAGFAPAAEDSTGTIVDIRARGARVAAPPRRRAPPTGEPNEPDTGRDRRGTSKGGGRAVHRHATRPDRRDHTTPGGRPPSGIRGDRIRRPGRCSDPAGRGTHQRPRWTADRLRSGVGQGARVRDPPRHVGGVRRLGLIFRGGRFTLSPCRSTEPSPLSPEPTAA